MAPQDDFSDDYVAQLLAKDAKLVASRHSIYGLQDSLPRRAIHNAPKPNKRFLKNIIKETDNHNAALRAKEAQEVRARLKLLKSDGVRVFNDREDYGRLENDFDGHRPKRRRRGEGIDSDNDRSALHKYGRVECQSKHDNKDRSRHRHGRGRRHHEDDAEQPEFSRHHHRHRRRLNSSSVETQDCRLSRSRSRSPKSNQNLRHGRRFRSYRRRDSDPSKTHKGGGETRLKHHKNPSRAQDDPSMPTSNHRGRSSSSASNSDPLEAIIGPPLPPLQPTIRSRGRGAMTASFTSAIDTHFASNYDPADDAHPDPHVELNDWDQALEALHDRQKWQQQSAERLKAAGFSEEEVAKWARGKKGSLDVEKAEEDVKWRGRGEAREWDRGKVLTDDGVETGAEWGRLKGS